jgi:hypothetical protein
MRDLAELNVLLRLQAEMPEGLKLATDYFRDGWHRLRATSARGLETKIKARKWHFIRTPKCITGSGTGTTPQQAVVRALDHALSEVRPYLNAIEVADIQSTQYPWFWLTRIRLETYRIQEGEFLDVPHEMMSLHDAATQEMDMPGQSIGNQDFADEGSRMPEMAMSSGGTVTGR